LDCEIHVLTQNCDSEQTESAILWEGCNITYFGWKGGETPLVEVLKKGLSGIILAFQYFRNGIKTGKKIAKEWKPDFIFAEWLVPAGLIANRISKKTNIPYTARALGSDVLVLGKKPIFKNIVRFVAKNADDYSVVAGIPAKKINDTREMN